MSSSVRSVRSSSLGPAPSGEDLSCPLKTMFMQDSGDEVQRAYLGDMAKLAGKYDFKLVIQMPSYGTAQELALDLCTRTGLSLAQLRNVAAAIDSKDAFSAWGEDNKIITNPDARTGDMDVLVPPMIDHHVLAWAQGYTKDEGFHAYSSDFQGAVSGRDEGEIARRFALSLGQPVFTTRSYLEGGNVLPGTGRDGKPCALVGRDSVIVTAFHLMASDGLDRTQWAHRAKTLRTSIDEVTLARVQDKLTWAEQQATPEDAVKFLAAIEMSKETIASDLRIPYANLTMLTQAEFHIDMCTRPLRPDQVMLNHPAEAWALLNAMLEPGATRLKVWERTELEEMQSKAFEEIQTSGPVYDTIKAELEAAGKTVLLAPGIFASSTRQNNFMNGVPGTDGRGETFYFVNGSSILPLQKAVGKFLKEKAHIDHVEFVAREGGGSATLSAGEISVSWSGAMDCREVHTSALYRGPNLFELLPGGSA